ncbi:MAG: amino acid ABC transporter permease [Caenispirillum bisanense]|nr:amino acid ABC transporter permease [Caenispirillum bisanense]MCA1973342.1 amino acid ABC transporter permease [Caenispirillum sp.]
MRTDERELRNPAFTHTEEPDEPTAGHPPTRSWDLLGWTRKHLFSSIPNTILTLLCLYLLWLAIPPVLDWAFISAVWSSDTADACKVEGAGACWAFVEQKHRFILFGLYPFDEQWRPMVAVVLFIGLIAGSCWPGFWRKELLAAWAVGLTVCGILMWGGVFGLTYVENSQWGGVPLTLILSVVGIVAAMPLAVLLALGRRSNLPAIKTVCVTFIELIRGVPLISVLFMASIMFPLFMPEGVTIDKLLRAVAGITLFTSAYLAEAIRGGLQSLPQGQYEAADSLGLNYWQKTRLIILPQALRIVIPPLVNQFISTFKDTSLVIIIGLYDLLTTAKTALADPEWRQFYAESYIFAAALYFCFAFFMSRYSQFLERRLNTGTRR